MLLKDFSFELPEYLIATKPAFPRDSSKLLCLLSRDQYEETQFSRICDYLLPGDLLVTNDTKVKTSKITGLNKESNKKIEFTFISNEKEGIWLCLALPGKKVHEGSFFLFKGVEGKIIKKNSEEIYIDFDNKNNEFTEVLKSYGKISLPPYISKFRSFDKSDNENYQTVYAKKIGSVAAPTAGLHFTESLLNKIKTMNIDIESVTLNIGPGTFLPLRNEKIEDNTLHSEKFFIPEETAKSLNNAYKNKNRRIISVGTTSLRVLESAFDNKSLFKSLNSSTDIFIYPGKKIKSINGLITNFHLTQSSLFLLICALIGTKTALDMYNFAIKNKYRFYSYGDACFLLNKNYG